MVTTVTAICRYPVKGLSAERMNRVALTPGECCRKIGASQLRPQWLPKIVFIMLMRDEKLAQLQTRFETESGVFGCAGRRIWHRRLRDDAGHDVAVG